MTAMPQRKPVSGFWRAEITKLSGPSAWVVIPRIYGTKVELGPCMVMVGFWTEDQRTKPETETDGAHYQVDGDGVHTHRHSHRLGEDLKVGDEVIVGFLEGISSQPIVFGPWVQ